MVSKEEVLPPKFYFIFIQLSSFSKFTFPVDSRRFKFLVIFAKYSLKVLEMFLLSLKVSFSSAKIVNQLFHLCLGFQRMSFQLTSVYSKSLFSFSAILLFSFIYFLQCFIIFPLVRHFCSCESIRKIEKNQNRCLRIILSDYESGCTFIPLILQSIRITSHCNTLIDNIWVMFE